MRGQVRQRDRLIAAHGDGDAVGQIRRYRIVERDLAALRHVGQQDRRKDFGDRPDLEERVLVDVLVAGERRAAVAVIARPLRRDNADDDADVVAPIDAGGDGFDHVVGQIGPRLRHHQPGHRQRPQRQQARFEQGLHGRHLGFRSFIIEKSTSL